jgi:hypothetical protein
MILRRDLSRVFSLWPVNRSHCLRRPATKLHQAEEIRGLRSAVDVTFLCPDTLKAGGKFLHRLAGAGGKCQGWLIECKAKLPGKFCLRAIQPEQGHRILSPFTGGAVDAKKAEQDTDNLLIAAVVPVRDRRLARKPCCPHAPVDVFGEQGCIRISSRNVQVLLPREELRRGYVKQRRNPRIAAQQPFRRHPCLEGNPLRNRIRQLESTRFKFLDRTQAEPGSPSEFMRGFTDHGSKDRNRCSLF